MKLLIVDLDGVLVKESLAYRLTLRYRREGLKYWSLYSEGKISMTELAVNVAKTHMGLSYDQIVEETEKVEKYPHLKEFIERLKNYYLIAIISAEYFNMVKKTAKELGIIHYFGNEIIFQNNKHSGKLWEPILEENEKARIALDLKKRYRINKMVSIGDDKTNMKLFKVSDFSIAFNGIGSLRKIADVCIDSENILNLL